MLGQPSLEVEAQSCGARERVGRDDGTGIVLAAVDAVGVASQGMDAGLALERQRQRQKEFGVASAATGAGEGSRRLAARQQ